MPGTREWKTVKAQFIEPMLLERTSTLPEGRLWRYEVKWDGYRAIAFTTKRNGQLRSRNDNPADSVLDHASKAIEIEDVRDPIR
jgi:ATP-dependent DNA ligase